MMKVTIDELEAGDEIVLILRLLGARIHGTYQGLTAATPQDEDEQHWYLNIDVDGYPSGMVDFELVSRIEREGGRGDLDDYDLFDEMKDELEDEDEEEDWEEEDYG
jgi:hypothetical protein